MALSTSTNRYSYIGDNTITDFSFPALFYDASHIAVYLDGVLQVSGYTVTGVGNPAGGTVSFTSAPGTGVVINLLRTVPNTQDVVLGVAGAFPAKTVEKALDLVTMGNQQFAEILERAITLPVQSSVTNADIPDPGNPTNYGKGLKIASDGSGLDTFVINAGDIGSLLTTKGDLLSYSGAADRLPVGANNTLLVADSTAGFGVKWSASLSGLTLTSPALTTPTFSGAYTLAGTPTLTIADNKFLVTGSADATKKISFEADGITAGQTRTVTVPDRSLTLGPTLTTKQAASGTTVDFSSIPAGTRRITVMLANVSTNGTSRIMVQLGTASSFETASYFGSVNNSDGSGMQNFGNGFDLNTASVAAGFYSGQLILNLFESGGNTWVASGALSRSDNTGAFFTSGSKLLALALTRVRLTMENGTDTFDSGNFNISYE